MKINANNITHDILKAHMLKTDLKKEALEIKEGLLYGLYDNKMQPIYTQINSNIDFTKQFYRKGNSTFYIDKGATGHLGVSYVVIKESILHKVLSNSIVNIIAGTTILYIIIALIGIYLAKLFISPIQQQREKINDFVKNTTHELNTPLSAILLCVDSQSYYTEKNRNHIKISAKKLSNLYKDLTYLFFKDYKQDEQSLNNIATILLQELEYHTELANKKSISISHDIEETFIKIEAECFIRIINNLISNAIKYTKRKGEITIILKNNVLSIKDTGIGIEKEKQDKIFNRYYRATHEIGGFGIGLDIVYSICKNYNITIDVKSQIKEGTTFTLHFPQR